MINMCQACKGEFATIEYKGSKLCKDCYIRIKLQENTINNKDLRDNTFVVKGNGKEYYGTILGYQHKISESRYDKFYLHINVTDGDYYIFYDNWLTQKEIMNSCNRFKINIEKLLKD